MVWSVKVGYLKAWYFYVKRKESSAPTTIYKKKICQGNIYKHKNYCFNFLFLFKKMEDSFTILERYINEKKPGYIIKKVSADRLRNTLFPRRPQNLLSR